MVISQLDGWRSIAIDQDAVRFWRKRRQLAVSGCFRRCCLAFLVLLVSLQRGVRVRGLDGAVGLVRRSVCYRLLRPFGLWTGRMVGCLTCSLGGGVRLVEGRAVG